ncbi:MAG: hypothetical protein ACK44P_02585 [Bacteroidota bacterium]|jgi:hypothetical protein|nr:hypothetical protein [Sphingobacteriales bacterium]
MSDCPFTDQVIASLDNDWKIAAGTPFNSNFPCINLPSKNIFVECIDLVEINKSLPDSACFKSSADTNYTRIKLWSDVWQNHRSIVISRLQAYSGKGRHIHGRDTDCVRLDKQTSQTFLKMHHLQGSTSAYYKYGLVCNDALVAVATFSKSRVMANGPVYYRSYELERFCAATGLRIVGGLSKLVSHFLQQHQAKHLMTYADADWGTGHSYAKLGFTFEGYVEPQLFYCTNNIRYAANRLPVHINKNNCLIAYNSGAFKYILNRL